MMAKKGEITGEIGLWLETIVHAQELPFGVFYDHYNQPSQSVGEIQGFIGETPANENILTNADIMVVDRSQNIRALIEIEDKSILNPKKLIGTVFTTLMCNRFAFGKGKNKKYYTVNEDTIFIVAGFFNKKGKKTEQLESVIKSGLQEFKTEAIGLQIKNVQFIFEFDIESTCSRLQQELIHLIENNYTLPHHNL